MGLAVARQLAEKGANIVIIAREEQRLIEALKHIQVCHPFIIANPFDRCWAFPSFLLP